jgi:hypothetical protein
LDFLNQAAGPVFVAAADFQQQINSGLSITGTQAIKFMTVLVSIMIPYTRGFSYQPSCSLDPALSGVLSCFTTLLHASFDSHASVQNWISI